MVNESIVASGIYFFHFENISTSKFAFRQAVREPDYNQGTAEALRQSTIYQTRLLSVRIGGMLLPRKTDVLRFLIFINIKYKALILWMNLWVEKGISNWSSRVTAWSIPELGATSSLTYMADPCRK